MAPTASAPRSTSSARSTRTRRALKIIHSPEFRKRMSEIGAEPIGNTSEQMAQQIKDETDKFAKLVKDAKVAVE